MSDILGGIGYNKSDGTNKLVVACNGDLLVYNSSGDTWDAQNQYLTVTSKVEFDTFLDYLFAVDYTQPNRVYNGSTWSQSTNVTSSPNAKYIKVYGTKVYLGYCKPSTTLYASRVYFSSLPSSDTITWDTTNDWFDVRTDDGDVITGFGLNSNRLLIFKTNSLYRWDTYSLQDVRGSVGTTSQRSVANVRDYTIFLHNTGFYAYNGVNSQLISNAVKPYIDGIASSSLATAVAWTNGNHYYCFVGDITNSDEDISLTNAVFDYDVSSNNWTIRTLQDVITCAFANTVSNARTLYAGTSGAKIRKLENGNYLTSATNTQNAIPFEVETIEYYPENPEDLKQFQYAYVYSSKGSGISMAYRVVGKPSNEAENWIPTGQLHDRVSRVDFDLSKSRGRGIQFKFMESSICSPFYLEGFTIYYKLEGLK